MRLAPLLLLLLALPAAAQHGGGPLPDQMPEPDAAALKPDPVPELTIDDARMNFRTVIESFLAANAPEGVWNFKDKRTKQVRRLSLFAIDEKSVKKTQEEGRYRGKVAFREEGAELPVEFEFTVDLGGESWRVVKARLLRKGAR